MLYLNAKKCKVMHFGARNPRSMYTISDPISGTAHQLEVTSEERDLGVVIRDDLSCSSQVKVTTDKANRMIGILRNTFCGMSIELARKLYTTFVRPHVEFAGPAWAPWLQQDIDNLERVQRRMTRIPHKLQQQSYEERLK